VLEDEWDGFRSVAARERDSSDEIPWILSGCNIDVSGNRTPMDCFERLVVGYKFWNSSRRDTTELSKDGSDMIARSKIQNSLI